ncbi:hypothetical protein FRC10_011801 [Ceratobasidium sp. 414]|nr:hypothetical protein FRC10_011801 [Ceratobasidium sp. 414]
MPPRILESAASMVIGPHGILSLDGLVNPFTPSEPPAPTTFAETLLLDSTSLLRGLLRASQTIRYAVATAGPVTVISHPATSRNAAVIRWASGANGRRTTIETEGVIITLDSWLKVSDWGSTKYTALSAVRAAALDKMDREAGALAGTFSSPLRPLPTLHRTPSDGVIIFISRTFIGPSPAVDLDRRVLAVLVSRKSALGTRLKLTSTGLPHADALLLTALITITGPHDWKRYPATGNQGASVPVPLAAAAQSEHALPTYGQAPFTRPLASLTGANMGTRRGAALSVPNLTITRPSPTPNPALTAGQPIILTLDSRQLLSGVFSHDGRPEIVITTIGPYTTLARYITSDDLATARGDVDVDGRRLKRIAHIEWVSSSFKGKRLTRVRMRGQKKIVDEIMYSSNMFFENRERRFGSHNFLPWITWAEASSRTSSSLSLASSSSSSVRYICRSHPDGRPLAVLSRRLTSAGTQLELTPEGWDILDAVLLTGLLVICGSHDWKRVAGIGVPVQQPEEGEDGDGMALGEEMVTGLDGWTSPPELVEMGGASGMYTPRNIGSPRGVGSGAVTPGGLGVGMGGLDVGGTTPLRATPVGSRAPSPPPYLP